VKGWLGVKQKGPHYIVVSGIPTLIFGFAIVYFLKSNLEQIRVQGYVLKKDISKNSGGPLVV